MILEVEDEFGGFIKMKTENITTDVIHLQNRFLLGKEETKELHLEETDERIELDDIDKEILEVLCKDARMPIVKIADEVEQSPKVVAYRIRKLEEKKLIFGIPALSLTTVGSAILTINYSSRSTTFQSQHSPNSRHTSRRSPLSSTGLRA